MHQAGKNSGSRREYRGARGWVSPKHSFCSAVVASSHVVLMAGTGLSTKNHFQHLLYSHLIFPLATTTTINISYQIGIWSLHTAHGLKRWFLESVMGLGLDHLHMDCPWSIFNASLAFPCHISLFQASCTLSLATQGGHINFNIGFSQTSLGMSIYCQNPIK
jgi:hypothetical protein